VPDPQTKFDTSLHKVDYEFFCDEGPDAQFRVYRFHLVEGINETYEMRLELVTEDLSADVELFLSAACELTIARDEHIRNQFGIISSVEYVGRSEDRLIVALTIVPACALLRQQTRSRIFQEMSVIDVVSEVLGDGLGAYSRTFDVGSAARGTEVRDYCVQYNESEWDFVTRLLEEEGINYAFVQDPDAGHEVLTLFHENDDYPDMFNIDGTNTLPIIVDRPDIADVESLQTFTLTKRLTSTSAWRRDYDFLTPTSPLDEQSNDADTKGYDRRIFTHMRRRFVADDVADRNTDQLQAAQMNGAVVHATGNVILTEHAHVFLLDRHVNPDLETSFVVTRAIHTGECPEELIGGGQGGAPRYTNRFQAVLLDQPIRPVQRTKKPRVLGPQTGLVTGPSGEEIHTDEHGRIKVRFHWEEALTSDDNSSCWIRVAQSWAGPGWGTQFIPRIGMEVVVSFLEGNPDRPLVTGCVYNGDNAPPFALPDNKTQTGWRTDSVSGDGYNMLRFEDIAGSEEIFIHAQKDKNVKVLNSRTGDIGNDDTLTIGHNRVKDVGNDQNETVTNNKTITVGGNHTETVGKDQQITVQGNANETVVKNKIVTVTGKQDVTIANTEKKTVGLKSDEIVGAMKSVKVGGLYSEQVGASRSITAVGAFSITAGLTGKFQCVKSITIKAQKKLIMSSDEEMEITSGKPATIDFKDDVAIKGAKKADIEVTDQINIKCGSAELILKKNGDININGKKINIKGSGDVVIKGSKIGLN
jgi:type VI secretion system secreted protein VgrG